MTTLTRLSALVALILTGAIFGFFYAYACSAMWGLDVVDPRAAITAMQGINAEVRNAAFMPAFFLTPLALAITALLARGRRDVAACFGAAAAIYLFGGLVLTMAVNVPMNETLGALTVPESLDDAAAIWAEYSPRWQLWNAVRTGFSGLALLFCGLGLMRMCRGGAPWRNG